MTMMNKILGFVLLLFLIAAADPIVFRATARAAVPLRERISQNADWRFQKGDPPGTEGRLKYEPGELKVVTYKNGKRWAEDVMKTTGPASRLLMKADHGTVRADGQDLSFIVTVAGKDGWLVPRSKNRVGFEISGSGEIVAVDNGDATDHESSQAKERKAYNGLVLVIVRAKSGQPGQVKLAARSDGLAETQISIYAR
jgi:beta-galactosidase